MPVLHIIPPEDQTLLCPLPEEALKKTEDYVDDYLPSTSTAPLLRGIEAKSSEGELLQYLERNGADEDDSDYDSSADEESPAEDGDEAQMQVKKLPSKSLPVNQVFVYMCS